MRLGTIAGFPVLVRGGRAADISTASGGRFSSHRAVFDDWDGFTRWAEEFEDSAGQWRPFEPSDLGPAVPEPRQVFAIGLNYRPHVDEAGLILPREPMVFTKFASCLWGPYTPVPLPSSSVDWELELVVVIARRAERVPVDQAWGTVAGLLVGQDLSERDMQFRSAPPQFSLGKSFRAFGPIGPTMATLDEVADPDDLEMTGLLNGKVVQQARTSEMVFSIPELVEYISGVCSLLPGDLIFTGTPGGTGNRSDPQRFLKAGDELVSRIAPIGEMRHVMEHSPGFTSRLATPV